MSVLGLVASSNYIPVNRELIKLLGLEEAVIFGQLCSEYDYWEKQNRLDEDGMFYCSVTKMEQATGISEYQQRRALKSLQEQGLITVKLKRVPATRCFYIDESQFLKIYGTGSLKITEQVPEKLQPSNNHIIKTENTYSISKDIEYTQTQPSQSFDFGKPKQKKQSLYSKCMAHIQAFTNNIQLQQYLKDFLDSLAEMDKLRGEKQFVGILNKLNELAGDVKSQSQIVQYTLEHGYATFYGLKTNNYNKAACSSDIGKHSPQYTAAQKEYIRKARENGTAEKY